MVELRLHLELYSREAIDEAVQTFSPYGQIDALDEPPYRVLRVSAPSPERERGIAGELGNYALGTALSRTDDEPDATSGSGGDETAAEALAALSEPDSDPSGDPARREP